MASKDTSIYINTSKGHGGFSASQRAGSWIVYLVYSAPADLKSRDRIMILYPASLDQLINTRRQFHSITILPHILNPD